VSRLPGETGKASATDASKVGDAVNAGVLTFLNAHVKQETASLELMQSMKLEDTVPGKVRYEQK